MNRARIQHAATSPGRPSTARDLHYATAVASLAEDELHQFTATPGRPVAASGR